MIPEPDDARNHVSMNVSGNPNAVYLLGNVGSVHIPKRERVIPRHVPPHTAQFSNRVQELATLNAILDDSQLILVDGEAGVGKTDLVSRWAQPLRDRFPDGFVYCDLLSKAPDGTVNLPEILVSMLRAVGIPDEDIRTDVDDLINLWWSVTAEARLLVVLDNMNEPALLRSLKPSAGPATTVLISRLNAAAFLAEGASRVTVPPFSIDHSRALLSKVCGPQRLDAEPDATDSLLEICAGRPQTVSLLGGCLASKPGLTIADVLRSITSQPAENTDEVAAVFAEGIIVDTLDQPEKQLYRQLLSHPPQGFSTALADAISGAADSKPLLNELVANQLIRPEAPGRWRVSNSGGAEPDPAVMKDFIDWYRRAARIADLTYLTKARLRITDVEVDNDPRLPSFSHSEAMDWLETELPNLLAVQRYAAEHGHDESVVSIEESLWVLYLHRKHPGHREYTSRLAIEAAERWGDHRAESRMRAQRGRHLMDMGDPDDALKEMKHAKRLALAAQDELLEASATEMIGRVHFDQLRYSEAESAYLDALAIYHRHRDERGLALVRQFLSRVYSATGDTNGAMTMLHLAREGFVACDLGRDEGSVLLDLGRLHADLGNIEQAILTLKAANVRLSEFKQNLRLAISMTLLGDLYQSQGEAKAAARSWTFALHVHLDQHQGESAPARLLRDKLAAVQRS